MEPLIQSKFSLFAEEVSAVWFWKKLVFRGSTRDKKGGEGLAYFKGGFGRLAEAMVAAIQDAGGIVSFNEKVLTVRVEGDELKGICTNRGEIRGRQFLFTPSFSIIADIFEGAAEPSWIQKLRRVKYLGNLCLVLRLKQSLSDIYWTNVNDPGFPFVGVIEHTNFDSPTNYKGTRIAFLSRYLAVDDPLDYSEEEYLEFALQHLKRMFPEVIDLGSLSIDYGVLNLLPVTERNYSSYLPALKHLIKMR